MRVLVSRRFGSGVPTNSIGIRMAGEQQFRFTLVGTFPQRCCARSRKTSVSRSSNFWASLGAPNKRMKLTKPAREMDARFAAYPPWLGGWSSSVNFSSPRSESPQGTRQSGGTRKLGLQWAVASKEARREIVRLVQAPAFLEYKI